MGLVETGQAQSGVELQLPIAETVVVVQPHAARAPRSVQGTMI
jgi:hypothetical protein